MRQTAPRRHLEKIAAPKSGRLSVAAGEPLDVGMTVSVYCAGSAAPAQEASTAADDAGPNGTDNFTEH